MFKRLKNGVSVCQDPENYKIFELTLKEATDLRRQLNNIFSIADPGFSFCHLYVNKDNGTN